jgi:hypothetical protein
LAVAARADPRSLYRLLRALASIGILRELDDGRFALTAVGGCLLADVPNSVASVARFNASEYYRRAWGELTYSVRTGESAFRHLYGTDVWEYRADHPDERTVFAQAMTAMTRAATRSLLSSYDFGRFGTIMDVGGGNGGFIAAVLAKHPTMRGILLDRPGVIARPDRALSALRSRCEIVGGDFFDAIPGGADCYVLKSVLHDWDDDDAVQILRTCRQAVSTGGSLLVIELDLGSANQDPEAKFIDLHMLVVTGGRERTLDEYSELLARADFRVDRVTHPAGSDLQVIEAT